MDRPASPAELTADIAHMDAQQLREFTTSLMQQLQQQADDLCQKQQILEHQQRELGSARRKNPLHHDREREAQVQAGVPASHPLRQKEREARRHPGTAVRRGHRRGSGRGRDTALQIGTPRRKAVPSPAQTAAPATGAATHRNPSRSGQQELPLWLRAQTRAR